MDVSKRQRPKETIKGTAPEAKAQPSPPPPPPKTEKIVVKNEFFSKFWGFLGEEADLQKVRADESDYFPKHRRVLAQIRRQTLIILGLSATLILSAPFLQPININQAISPSPQKIIQPLVTLTEPNLTDHAVLSWVATSITEIMTFGFGDFDQRILAQKRRFTQDGWESFLDALREHNMRDDFKMRQLVLTTVPSDSPVIVEKGVDVDGDSIWTVEMPVVMTYITNNNVRSAKRSIVRLIIARVPAKENIAGIGIKSWKLI